MLKMMCLLNWGIGLEILKQLAATDSVKVCCVVTQYDPLTKDVWRNVVYDHALKIGVSVANQDKADFDWMRTVIKNEKIDLMFVHSYMRKIPRSVFGACRLGGINVHPSLLPKYRGPAPTSQALREKETKTGLTCHYMDDDFDTGDIIAQVEVALNDGDSVESVIEKEKRRVPELLHKCFSNIRDPLFAPQPQPRNGEASSAVRRKKNREK